MSNGASQEPGDHVSGIPVTDPGPEVVRLPDEPSPDDVLQDKRMVSVPQPSKLESVIWSPTLLPVNSQVIQPSIFCRADNIELTFSSASDVTRAKGEAVGERPPADGDPTGNAPGKERTGAGGFNLYPTFTALGERLEFCIWRQVFLAKMVFLKWDRRSGDIPRGSETTFRTGSGDYKEPPEKGHVDWGPESAVRPKYDQWRLKTSSWVFLKMELRTQITARRDQKFENPRVCRDYTLVWTNLRADSRAPASRMTMEGYHKPGRDEMDSMSGQLYLTVHGTDYWPSCKVK